MMKIMNMLIKIMMMTIMYQVDGEVRLPPAHKHDNTCII